LDADTLSIFVACVIWESAIGVDQRSVWYQSERNRTSGMARSPLGVFRVRMARIERRYFYGRWGWSSHELWGDNRLYEAAKLAGRKR